MKTGIGLQDLAVEIDRQNTAKRDFIVDTRSARFFEPHGAMAAAGISFSNIPKG